jgi:formylglycine-generating enzyme required for sulfatase activity
MMENYLIRSKHNESRKLKLIFIMICFICLSCADKKSQSTGDIIDDTEDTGPVGPTNPGPPSSMTLLTPAFSPNFDDRPWFRVEGVENGYTVTIYTDPSCTTTSVSGSSIGSTIDLQVSSLPIGSTNFYAMSTDEDGLNSACSPMLANYSRTLCPIGYVEVLSNSAVGTNNTFCVMKYEAKCSTTKEGLTSCPSPTGAPEASKVAVSTDIGLPWTSISGHEALEACQDLNALHGVSNKFDLISNAEWMTVARSIEAKGTNWTNDGGYLKLSMGHADTNPPEPCDGTIINVQNNCSTLDANPSNFHQKRTFILNNNEIVWDVAGNVWEWVDWTIETPSNTYSIGPQGCAYGPWTEIQSLISSCNPNLGSPSPGVSSLASPLNTSLSGENNNIGRGQGGTGLAVVRGGHYYASYDSGIYSLFLDVDAQDIDSTFGFRCVYRP